MNKVLIFLVILISLLAAQVALAQEPAAVTESDVAAVGGPKPSDQLWEFEIGTGFWMPQNSVLDAYFTKCCNLITKIEGGVLFDKKYGIVGGAGVLYKTAAALGVTSGQPSQDRFKFLLIPFNTDFIWRADYFDWRWIVPYARAGLDYVFFQERDVGKTINGVKFGMHYGLGAQINIGDIGDTKMSTESDFGIDDMFITLEGKYQWINNFGAKGLDLSGLVCSIGLLFEF